MALCIGSSSHCKKKMGYHVKVGGCASALNLHKSTIEVACPHHSIYKKTSYLSFVINKILKEGWL